MDTMTIAGVVIGVSILAALLQSLATWRLTGTNLDLLQLLRQSLWRWAWVAGSLAVLCLAAVPLLGVAGWALGLLMMIAIIPVATFTMAIAAPVPWGWAALVTGLLHACGQGGMWLAGAQLPDGDRTLLVQVFTWNAVAVSIAAWYRCRKPGG